MNLKKKAQVIMLPTKHSNLSLYENKLSLAKANHNGIPDKMIPQHLFIVDDSEIKEPCYAYCKSTNTMQWLSEIQVKVLKKDNWSKVIATTDSSLEIVSKGINPVYEKLPQPSEQFIQKYVESYNKGNVITDVMVEYEGIEWLDNPLKYFPKVDSKNQVTITRCKDSWNREEEITGLIKLKDGSLSSLDNYLASKTSHGYSHKENTVEYKEINPKLFLVKLLK